MSLWYDPDTDTVIKDTNPGPGGGAPSGANGDVGYDHPSDYPGTSFGLGSTPQSSDDLPVDPEGRGYGYWSSGSSDLRPGAPAKGSDEDRIQTTVVNEVKTLAPGLSDADVGALGIRVLHELGAKQGLSARDFVDLYSGKTSDEIKSAVDRALNDITTGVDRNGERSFDFARGYMEKLYGTEPVHLAPHAGLQPSRPSPYMPPEDIPTVANGGLPIPYSGRGTYAPGPGFTAPTTPGQTASFYGARNYENYPYTRDFSKAGMPAPGELPTIFDLVTASGDPRAQSAIRAYERFKGGEASQAERNIIGLDLLARAPGNKISNPEFEPKYLDHGADVLPGLKDFLRSYDWENPPPDQEPHYPFTLADLAAGFQGALATEVKPVSELLKMWYGTEVDPKLTTAAAIAGDLARGNFGKLVREPMDYALNTLEAYKNYGMEFLQSLGDAIGMPPDIGDRLGSGQTPEQVAAAYAKKYEDADPLSKVIANELIGLPFGAVDRLGEGAARIKEAVEGVSKVIDLAKGLQELFDTYKDLFFSPNKDAP